MDENQRIRSTYWDHWHELHKTLPSEWLVAWSWNARGTQGVAFRPDVIYLAVLDAVEVEMNRRIPLEFPRG